jgi:hypothetical protein
MERWVGGGGHWRRWALEEVGTGGGIVLAEIAADLHFDQFSGILPGLARRCTAPIGT